ncbi:hypothetical protein N2152v2_007428 [Parachlorella kessleri]
MNDLATSTESYGLTPWQDFATKTLPRLQLHPPTPEAPQKAIDVLVSSSEPESPRTPKGAAIPQTAYTVCPGAPRPPNHLLGPSKRISPQPWWICKDATLKLADLQKQGLTEPGVVYDVIYNGRGQMPGYGLECAPKLRCTFAKRLTDEEIRGLAAYVLEQAAADWPVAGN